MKYGIAGLLVVHGLIHLLGFVKAFELAQVSQLQATITRPVGVLWLVAALLLVRQGLLARCAKAVLLACTLILQGCATSNRALNPVADKDGPPFAFLMNYVEPEDFGRVASWGINTVLVDLELAESDWVRHYEAAIQHRLKVIPLIWGDNQSVWVWNERSGEWELNVSRYPSSAGARFLQFLRDNPRYLKQTFAIYGFHEPLAEPERSGCERLKKFYQQITREEFPDGSVRVYHEDFSMGWHDSDRCRGEITDYESHNIYPFADNGTEIYRPFNAKTNEYEPPTSDLQSTLRHEIAALDERLSRWARVALPGNSRRPQVIVILQTFAAEGERDRWNLWNRMPSADEMRVFARHVLQERGSQIAGFAWYPFEPVAEEYSQVLKSHRYDRRGQDRWEVIRDTCTGGIPRSRP